MYLCLHQRLSPAQDALSDSDLSAGGIETPRHIAGTQPPKQTPLRPNARRSSAAGGVSGLQLGSLPGLPHGVPSSSRQSTGRSDVPRLNLGAVRTEHRTGMHDAVLLKGKAGGGKAPPPPGFAGKGPPPPPPPPPGAGFGKSRATKARLDGILAAAEEGDKPKAKRKLRSHPVPSKKPSGSAGRYAMEGSRDGSPARPAARPGKGLGARPRGIKTFLSPSAADMSMMGPAPVDDSPPLALGTGESPVDSMERSRRPKGKSSLRARELGHSLHSSKKKLDY